MPMFPENSMSLKGREGTFPEIHCNMSRPISKNALFYTQYTSQVEAITFSTTTWAGITGRHTQHLTLNRTLCVTLKLTKAGQPPAT